MNRPVVNRLILLSLVFILGIQTASFSQMTGELKKFLWEKDITEMLSRYGEERVVLSDSGDYQKRLAQRSFREEQGLRIQTFAGADIENAKNMFDTLEQLELDSVYLVQEGELYKTQLGNFLYRLDAEKMLDRLRYAGITNAWIVETTIHLPREQQIDTTRIPPTETAPIEKQIIFSIQVFVTRDSQKANEFATRLKQQMSDEIWILQSGEFWKVLIGKYQEEDLARKRLSEIRDSGYADAWLTQVDD
jgi:hypothetical protein